MTILKYEHLETKICLIFVEVNFIIGHGIGRLQHLEFLLTVGINVIRRQPKSVFNGFVLYAYQKASDDIKSVSTVFIWIGLAYGILIAKL